MSKPHRREPLDAGAAHADAAAKDVNVALGAFAKATRGADGYTGSGHTRLTSAANRLIPH